MKALNFSNNFDVPTRSLSVKLVWLAAESGIPLPIVQSIVGHLSPKMTELYANHATDQAKLEKMKNLPEIFNPQGTDRNPPAATEPRDQKLLRIIKSMTPENLESKRNEAIELFGGLK